jgi:hypothetical protein
MICASADMDMYVCASARANLSIYIVFLSNSRPFILSMSLLSALRSRPMEAVREGTTTGSGSLSLSLSL